jgi:hypothetical protein
MANLTARYEVLVIAHYTSDEIEARSMREAQEEAIKMFYDESHRASIEDTRVSDEWLVCDDCNEERVEDDHECDEGNDVANYY